MNRTDFQSQGTLALRKEVLIMNVTGLTTISEESFNRRAGMRSKPSALTDFRLRNCDRTNSHRSYYKLLKKSEV